MTMCAAGQTKHETVTQGRLSGYGQEVGLRLFNTPPIVSAVFMNEDAADNNSRV